MIAGFCVLDDNYIDQALVCLSSLKETQDYEYDFYVFYRANTDVSRLEHLGFKMVPFTARKVYCKYFRYDLISDLLLQKLYCFESLSKQYSQVFNIDLDMHFRKSLKKVFEKYSEPYWYGCIEVVDNLTTNRRCMLNYARITATEYINLGFTILNTPINFDETEYLNFFNTCKFSDCPEQDYINYTYRHLIKIMPTDISWNHQLDFIFDPYIVHHLGPYKPYTIIPEDIKNIEKFMIFKKEYSTIANKYCITNKFKEKLWQTVK